MNDINSYQSPAPLNMWVTGSWYTHFRYVYLWTTGSYTVPGHEQYLVEGKRGYRVLGRGIPGKSSDRVQEGGGTR